MNNILLVVFEDFSCNVCHMKSAQTTEEAYNKVSGLFTQKVIYYRFISKEELPVMGFQSALKANPDFSLTFDRSKLINAKNALVRLYRDKLLSSLDLPYQIATQKKDDKAANKLAIKAQFLRDLPKALNYSEISSYDDIINDNPFNNVFDIDVIDGGSGYDISPQIAIIDQKGRGAKAVALMENGKVVEIQVTSPGKGYNAPIVIIDPPQNGTAAKAKARVSNNGT
jgi:hypothetical protein